MRSGENQKSGHVVRYNDDGGNGFNSRLIESLSAGHYTIEATTYYASRTGSFKLTVDGLPEPAAVDPEISIAAGQGVTEGGDAVFTVTADPAPSAALSVSVAVSQTGDYAATGSQTVTIPTSGSVALTVGTTNDSADESDGSVTVTLHAGQGYTVSATANTATVAVADDDVPEVSIVAGGGVTEGGDAVFTVTADPVPSAALSVDVTVAQSGDFGAATGSRQVTVSTSGSGSLTVSTTNDDADEPDGSVTVTVDGGSGYAVSSTASSASVAVADDDDPPPPPVCTVQLPSDAVTVSEVTGWRDAHDHDSAHVLRWNRVLAALGVDTGEAAMTVAESRGNEGQFMLSRWDRVTRTLEARAQCNNPSPPAPPPPPPVVEPEVSIAAGSGVTEGADAVFTVTADPAPSSPLTVGVTVAASGDFGVSTGSRQVAVPISGTVTLAVATTGDSVDEADGSVTVTVDDGSGYTVSATQGSAAVAVADDDDPAPPPPPPVVEPEVSIAAGSGVIEGADAVFTVTADPAPSAALLVDVTVAQSGDFGAATGARQVTVSTSGSATLTVSTVDDSVDESDGSVTVTVDVGSGYTVSSQAGSATVAVSDDDDPPPPPPPPVVEAGFSIEDASGTEGEQVSVTVTLSHASSQRLRVYWKTEFGGSSAWNPSNPIWAVTDVDFGRAGGWLTFEPGVVERQVQVSLLEDSRVEPVEEFQVNLVFVSPFGAVPIADRRAIITITDND